MSAKVPKEKRNEIMTLSDRKHFAAMIQNGAKYKEILAEHLTKIMEKMRLRLKTMLNCLWDSYFIFLSHSLLSFPLTPKAKEPNQPSYFIHS